MFKKILPILIIACGFLMLIGCGQSVSNRAAPTKFNGHITGTDGKPVRDITIQFLPQFLGSIQTAAKVGAAGKFEVELLPGKYVIMIEPNKGKQAEFKLIPIKYHSANKENEIDVVAGKEIEIAVSK